MNAEKMVCDVSVVGSGAAGLRAALEARRAGVDVLLISKGRTGLGNVTAVAGGGIVGAFGHADPNDNPDIHFEDTLASGRGLCDPDLVRVFADGACGEIRHLHRLGLAFRMESDEKFVQLCQPGHSYPRDCKIAGPSRTESWVPTFEGGRLLNDTLKKAAREAGVRVLERTVVFGIRTDDAGDGGVTGAVGLNADMNLVVVQCKALVLAAGGAGEVYQHNVTPPDTTGDGYRLALHLGVPLLDMEFVQFYPISIVEPGVPHWYLPYWYFFENGALLYNIKGEDVLIREGLSRIEDITRDKLARACGQHETILFDCTKMSDEVWAQPDFRIFREAMLKHRVDPRERPIQVSPTGYYFMGGIRIDAACWTGVPGLYAAGEVVGGIHGANRLGSNELSADLVFGAIAGREAAAHASRVRLRPMPESRVKGWEAQIQQSVNREKRADARPIAVRGAIQETMWKYAIWVRSGEGLSKGLAELERIRSERMPSMYARSFGELKQLLENAALLDTAEMTCRAALMRAESRGAHLRADCPEEDAVWEGNICITLDEDGMEPRFRGKADAKVRES